jgi:hypothetical protein
VQQGEDRVGAGDEVEQVRSSPAARSASSAGSGRRLVTAKVGSAGDAI